MSGKYIQCGTFALRTPKGEFLPSVPLYIREKDAGLTNSQTGLTVAEEITLTDVSKVFADKFNQYAAEHKKQGLAL